MRERQERWAFVLLQAGQGAPHLDGQYTVFGEVIEGMDTVERIEATETGAADRPRQDVRIIKMEII